jgi:flagellar basal-body rod protein FlgC
MGMFSTFEISAAGMNLERLRLDVSAVNLANAHTTRAPDGSLFTPLRVTTRPTMAQSFDSLLQGMRESGPMAAPFEAVVESANRPPRMVYEPGHPDADAQGFVTYPDVNPVSEMIELIAINRAYEANVRAMNIAKTMALKALEIGGDR